MTGYARGSLRYVVVVTASDGTITVCGAFKMRDRAEAAALKIEQQLGEAETVVYRLEQPAGYVRGLR